VSRANASEQRLGVTRHHRLVAIAVVFACRQTPRDTAFDDAAQASARVREMAGTCDGITRVLDRIAGARVTGRLLVGLVDEAIATTKCETVRAAVKGSASAHQLARARLDDARPEAALAQLTAASEPAIRLRRAELLDRLGRSDEALQALTGIELDDQAAELQRLLRISVAAKARKHDDVARVIAAAPLAEQPRLAHRAVEDAPVESLALLATAGSIEVALAAADRLEQAQGPAAVLAARERIATLDPSIAEYWDALGRARIAAGQIDEALAAWDRAIAIAPAQPAFRIAPIRALVIAHQPQRARARAEVLAGEARKRADVELVVTASSAAAAAGDSKRAVELAREARGLRTTDGRLAFGVAQRLAEAGETKQAADAYAELLVCGAHGRAWHRHEIAGKLQTLAGTSADAHAIVVAAVGAKRACETVEADDLSQYVTALSR
jgi:tetratricopeptide (TPR) repeat protein